MKVRIIDGARHGTQFATPHGRVALGIDGLYNITEEQREYLERAYGVTTEVADVVPAHETTETENAAAAIAQANIEANREAAQQHADESQRIPIPKAKTRRR
jgi:hypothetical protein